MSDASWIQPYGRTLFDGAAAGVDTSVSSRPVQQGKVKVDIRRRAGRMTVLAEAISSLKSEPIIYSGP